MNRSLRNKVSIVLPTYNGTKYIKQSIESCLNQTYKNIELIVVDDGSSENVKKLIDLYFCDDDRILYFRHDKNLGLPRSLNDGFARATGDYLTWTSDDNFYDKKAIEIMLSYLETNFEIDFVYTNYYIIDRGGNILKLIKVDPPKNLDWKNCVGPCFLYRRKVYEQIGEYNSECVLVEDYEYWLRVRKLFKMQKLNNYLYYYRKHEDSLSARNKNVLILQQTAKMSEKYVSLPAQFYHRGMSFFYKKEYLRSVEFFIKAFLLNPFKICICKMLLASFIGILSPLLLEYFIKIFKKEKIILI